MYAFFKNNFANFYNTDFFLQILYIQYMTVTERINFVWLTPSKHNLMSFTDIAVCSKLSNLHKRTYHHTITVWISLFVKLTCLQYVTVTMWNLNLLYLSHWPVVHCQWHSMMSSYGCLVTHWRRNDMYSLVFCSLKSSR